MDNKTKLKVRHIMAMTIADTHLSDASEFATSAFHQFNMHDLEVPGDFAAIIGSIQVIRTEIVSRIEDLQKEEEVEA